ncbi:NAD(P)-binding protein [Daldinia decipiens]|uniref:NAD(P)-binding protein n=1 Tax=Daldinia decipiens TaxID=326647 RepID=UPI0020C2994E|nr:NAD(P)-binding protein [Daldinia decipiens]KAI1654477.1 NAD(P)-binding protein [Daldinia decipiens]
MPSYVIMGASRGLGFEFLRQLSEDPAAVVIGLARDKDWTEKKVSSQIGRSNIHILHGDLDDYKSIKKAAEDAAKITGGGLDYLIANAAAFSSKSGLLTFNDMADDPEGLEEDLLKSFKANVVGNIHLFNYFLPLIRKGEAKKVISISTGIADYDFVRETDYEIAGSYTTSKAALNLAVVEYHAQFHHEGILFFSISPGVVATDGQNAAGDNKSEKELENRQKMFDKFAKYAPHFKGPMTPEESVKLVMKVIYNASLERGDGGSFVSHLGTRQWL